MRILVGLTYYRPHISGLTIYAEHLANAFAHRGHQVTILTSHYQHNLPREEMQGGVRIIRVPVAFRISKGVIMPLLGYWATKLVKENDIVNLHLPQFDAAGIAMRGRFFHKPTILTYHCDLLMPPGIISWGANQAVHLMNNLAANYAHRIVTYTRDYAENSSFLKHFLTKVDVIRPPVVLPRASKQEIDDFKKQMNSENARPVIGMAARFATEKGVEVLLSAIPRILEVFPNAVVQFAGPYKNIVGEEAYFRRLEPLINTHIKQGHWKFLGTLNPEKMSAFYPNIDVLVLPSLNSTEAFGLVQIEAMMNGVPVVASELPGVRQPVLQHRMGRISPIGDPRQLADNIIQVLQEKSHHAVDPTSLGQLYAPDTIALQYEELFTTIKP
jgi:glycosyltransferase involved in cell wall biosynthesis